MSRFITASKFKAECLGLLREVADTGEEIIVTKRGRPVARLVPVLEPPTLLGSITYLVSDEELIAPTGDRWEAESD
jgi:prevent-host-death family protein